MHYDFWWNLPRDYMVTSEWGLPPQFENGIVPEDLLSNKYGHQIHFWDLRARRNVQTIDLGANHQMVLEVRPAHDPVREYGFLGVVIDTTNLEGSIWTWWREGGKFHVEKRATISPEPAPKDQLPPLLQGFGAVPPLVTDIDLSRARRWRSPAGWGWSCPSPPSWTGSSPSWSSTAMAISTTAPSSASSTATTACRSPEEASYARSHHRRDRVHR